jgi:hypothetical protein
MAGGPDPLSPYIEVLTDFTPDHKGTAALRFELGRAVGRASAGPGEHVRPGGPGHRPPGGPLELGRVEIVVAGSARTAPAQSYRDFRGLQFTHAGLLVTVIARGRWPERPQFALVTDLEPGGHGASWPLGWPGCPPKRASALGLT